MRNQMSFLRLTKSLRQEAVSQGRFIDEIIVPMRLASLIQKCNDITLSGPTRNAGKADQSLRAKATLLVTSSATAAVLDAFLTAGAAAR